MADKPDAGALAAQIAAAMTGQLAKSGKTIAAYAKAEAQKLATSAVEIAALRATGVINDEQAKLHLDIQKHASRAVLSAIEGLGILAAEAAINAGLAVVRQAVNTFAGFDLIS